jgi:endoglucanase
LAAALLAGPLAAWGKEAILWERYKKTFITADGRVVDFAQGEASHSEGQGYSMLLAADYGDRDTFDKLWSWTGRNLAVRADGLLAWRWGRRLTGAWGVIDYNNATDGDLLVALALAKAGAKWNDPALTKSGLALARAVREQVLIPWVGRSYLLPGHFGFDFNGGFTLNPSYMVLPAFRLFANLDEGGKKTWEKIHADAMYLISKSSFGRMQVPADWVVVDAEGQIRLHGDKSPYSGKEAVRVFLYVSFEKAPVFPPGLDAILSFYETQGYIPLQVNLAENEVALAKAPGGYYAVYAKASAAKGKDALAKKLFKAGREALDQEAKNYYSMVLYLLATSEDAL